MIKKIAVMVALVLVFALIPMVMAAPGGATVVDGSAGSITTSSSDASNISGGQVRGANVSGTFSTSKWAGFYGSISGDIQLGDATDVFYQWTVSNMSGAVVFAVNGTTTPDWASLAAASNADMPASINGSATDNYTNTFTNTAAFSTNSIASIASTPYTETWQNGAQGFLRTYSLNDVTNNQLVWAAEAVDETDDFKAGSGTQVDYQLLVPTTGQTTYNFYVELP